jgi:WD40 repeat protein
MRGHTDVTQVKCWDLECNKVIRNYHGHLSAVYSLSVHPTLDVIVTGSRDSTARVCRAAAPAPAPASRSRAFMVQWSTPRGDRGIEDVCVVPDLGCRPSGLGYADKAVRACAQRPHGYVSPAHWPTAAMATAPL